jgi:radical SAM superfamily enzyme YgiQ (UPF0313 family)
MRSGFLPSTNGTDIVRQIRRESTLDLNGDLHLLGTTPISPCYGRSVVRSDGRSGGRFLDQERSRLALPAHGRFRIGVGYPNSYHVAQSSLAYQWAVELASGVDDVAIARFFAPPDGNGRTLDGDHPLSSLHLLAWSCSFELDAVNLIRTLDASAIPRRRLDRTHRHPLLVVGGPVASINPLPMSPAIDVFVLGAAELLWPQLIEMAKEVPDRDRLLAELADSDGYFVPTHHLDGNGTPLRRLRRVEKRDIQMADPAMVPSSHVVTPNTEYRNRGLVEMSRGCPEKCRYCWVSYNYGRLRSYPAEAVLDRVRAVAELTNRIGFVATAVGDHPQLPEILAESRALGLDVALSSLRIPAMVPEVLGPLAESGARSVTIAPETGSDALRAKLNKPISNERILEAVETAQECGITSLKMYFIIGLPDETDDDLLAIGRLLRTSREIMLRHGRRRGRMGTLHAGCSVLVPKPYTPYSRSAVLDKKEYRRRLALVEKGMRSIDNLRFDRPSHREALWQAMLSRGDSSTFELIEELADHGRLGTLLSEHRGGAVRRALDPVEGDPVWRFIGSAPTRAAARP